MKSKHHIIPRSKGGKNVGNIAYVDSRRHEQYHMLFDNRTPREIIYYLNRYFWANKYSGLEAQADKYEMLRLSRGN
jgi:hypothetical protein